MYFLWFLATAAPVSADGFSISAWATPCSGVNGAQLNAAKEGFYSGLSGPSTYCPLNPASSCPNVMGTLVSQNMEALMVEVPGGQQIYVQTDGQVKFTIPHSAYMPPGSITDGWHHTTSSSNLHVPTTQDVVYFDDGKGHHGLTLCPDIPDEMKGTGASFVLYAKTAGFSLIDCTDIGGLALTKTGHSIGCWQYE
ncbi:hypothetical protein HD806DRAFT_546692 [Xylariaceae sp. AK1471]|nr:hypothetical protein HD806DRAFT_546692 [Xylariaceae sp. AK1471]